MITAGDIRKGVIFDDGTSTDPKKPSLFLVVDFQHVKPGKGAAFVRTTLKNVLTGKVIERTYNPSEKINDISIERKEMMYLYNEGGLYYFMDNTTYEQIPFNYEVVEEALKFVVENTNCQVQFYNGQPISVEAPIFVELTITKCEPAVMGDTVKTGGKPATLETGYQIRVPMFVNEGDRVRVDTRTGEYMERL
ncbi:MAG: elongation factor P [Clostridia bacterium]|nr:elongation factor P [Clostridia bacterium]